MKSIANNPCSSCPGNHDLCSTTDETLQYNVLTCQLITDWILNKTENNT